MKFDDVHLLDILDPGDLKTDCKFFKLDFELGGNTVD